MIGEHAVLYFVYKTRRCDAMRRPPQDINGRSSLLIRLFLSLSFILFPSIRIMVIGIKNQSLFVGIKYRAAGAAERK